MGWHSNNVLDSYLGGAKFEPWPGRWIYSLRSCWFSSAPPGKCHGCFLPEIFQFVIHQSLHCSTVYSLSIDWLLNYLPKRGILVFKNLPIYWHRYFWQSWLLTISHWNYNRLYSSLLHEVLSWLLHIMLIYSPLQMGKMSFRPVKLSGVSTEEWIVSVTYVITSFRNK
jgi:hypothetical protein